MLSSVKVLGALPDLHQNLDWLPVDTAAQALVEIALKKADKLPPGTTKDDIPVYHILNPSRATTWTDLLRWMKKLSPGFDIISPAAWVGRLKSMQEDIVFETKKTKEVTPAMRDVKRIDEAQFKKMWRWIEQEMS